MKTIESVIGEKLRELGFQASIYDIKNQTDVNNLELINILTGNSEIHTDILNFEEALNTLKVVNTEYNLQESIKVVKEEKHAKLSNGFTSVDGKFWFNEQFGYIFCETLTTAITLEEETITWKSADREVVDISVTDAKVYLKEIKEFIKAIHFAE